MSAKLVKVKLNVGRAGNGFAHSPGDEIEVTVAEAKRMIAKGQCVEVATGASDADGENAAK